MENTSRPIEFDPTHITKAAHDSLTVRRVFGEAYEREGTLIIPVAKLLGGTGSGWGSGSGEMSGSDERPDERSPKAAGGGEGAGAGGGFGVRVRPLGVYVVDQEGTRWQPALDLNRVILGGQATAVVIAVIVGWALRRRRHR